MNRNKIIPVEAIGSGEQHEIARSFNNVLPDVSAPQPCGIGSGTIPNQTVASVKDTRSNNEKANVIPNDTFLYYCLPASAAIVAGTALLRYRQRKSASTVVEKFLLGGIAYYGATSLGATIGHIGYLLSLENKDSQNKLPIQIRVGQDKK